MMEKAEIPAPPALASSAGAALPLGSRSRAPPASWPGQPHQVQGTPCPGKRAPAGRVDRQPARRAEQAVEVVSFCGTFPDT